MECSLKNCVSVFSAVIISCFQRVTNTFHIRHPPQLPPLWRSRKFRVQSRYTVIYALTYNCGVTETGIGGVLLLIESESIQI